MCVRVRVSVCVCVPVYVCVRACVRALLHVYVCICFVGRGGGERGGGERGREGGRGSVFVSMKERLPVYLSICGCSFVCVLHRSADYLGGNYSKNVRCYSIFHTKRRQTDKDRQRHRFISKRWGGIDFWGLINR